MTNFLKKLISTTAGLALATTALLSPVAHADDEPLLGKIGYLKQGETETFPVYLESGERYVFIAGCDDDCSDLDMYLEKNGQVIEKDTETDATPVIILTDTPSGYYDVRIKMYSCSAEPCEFTVVGD